MIGGCAPLRNNRGSNINHILGSCVWGLWSILKINNYGDVYMGCVLQIAYE